MSKAADPSLAPDHVLAEAEAALNAGHTERARGLAHAALAEALRAGDLRTEALILSFLAHCDRLDSRLRRAAETSRTAAQIFERLGDAAGETQSLMTLAQVSMLLGRNEEAVEAALLSVRLCDLQAPRPLAVLALNSLGLAYSWSGDHGRAYAALEAAVDAARRCDPPISIYQPRLNQVWVVGLRLVDERFATGTMTRVQDMADLMNECLAMERAGQVMLPMPGMEAMRRTISFVSRTMVLAWQGDVAGSSSTLAAATRSLPGSLTWLSAAVRWCAAEIDLARGDLAAAVTALIEAKDMALAVSHEQLACRANLVLMQVYEQQGDLRAAMREYRELRSRERRVFAEGLGTRESLVAWRLGARQSERHLQEALVESKRFERWSLEDALTGIANRRHFELTLEAAMQAAVAPDHALAVAMIDVDKFKAVNDLFGHAVGDRVLKTVAELIGAQVRERDLLARQAGDEFVVLFREATRFEAQDICGRIQAAIAAFDWEVVAPGLRMSVSIGVSEIRAGDTVEAVLKRSDAAMYASKSQARSLPDAARGKPVEASVVRRHRLPNAVAEDRAAEIVQQQAGSDGERA
jgi:diguanylate cyclase (GGDEF)-like protein